VRWMIKKVISVMPKSTGTASSSLFKI